MEGLTKTYRQELLISEALFSELRAYIKTAPGGDAARLSFRLLDTVAVKGKTRGVKIFTVRRGLAENEARAWALHNEGMKFYYRRSFGEATGKFEQVLSLLSGDFTAQNLLERCRGYALRPPPETWDGVEVMKSK